MGLTSTATLFGAGYVLGARAGTGRYDQIAAAARRIMARPELQPYLGPLGDRVTGAPAKPHLARSAPALVSPRPVAAPPSAPASTAVPAAVPPRPAAAAPPRASAPPDPAPNHPTRGHPAPSRPGPSPATPANTPPQPGRGRLNKRPLP